MAKSKTDYFAQHTDYVASARIRRGPTVKRSVKGARTVNHSRSANNNFHALRSLDTCNPGTPVTYDLDKVISLSNRRPSYAVRSSWQYGYRFHKQCGLPIATSNIIVLCAISITESYFLIIQKLPLTVRNTTAEAAPLRLYPVSVRYLTAEPSHCRAVPELFMTRLHKCGT
ncbi:hypothetical protein EVAR_95561_1 [Eumeta japonica]|uniref:Uncharacterized protein n=1 Tax=Eumeta variegata TaxID=151549 RepID=A0A4C2A4L3_EUMVA|nr:hypothetical protein EVAR_95561_1 [Eumeta japonica]